ncbi:hypothetical protein NE237_004198 [Protea cynaroides]|uniref:Uncharacterized protein n=1 Tax=Protea cynaroides TaxID=273540 RepID=A0A9Q0QTG0_9MAGN|nr:hypothetical protein NE237_004198 [Protea cynaroides]
MQHHDKLRSPSSHLVVRRNKIIGQVLIIGLGNTIDGRAVAIFNVSFLFLKEALSREIICYVEVPVAFRNRFEADLMADRSQVSVSFISDLLLGVPLSRTVASPLSKV